MAPIRVHATVESDGELHLRGLPMHKGQQADVIIVPEEPADNVTLAMLRDDPGWAWLHDAAEDIYTEKDAR
ncbi:MAG TPA: hypothetical protein VIR57_02385 [Chloroflexota bacterium]|jgi:hypothetical protein